jgi:hypothetical protein
MNRHVVVTTDLARHITIGSNTISVAAKIMGSMAVPEWIKRTPSECEGWREKCQNNGRKPAKDFFHGTVEDYS